MTRAQEFTEALRSQGVEPYPDPVYGDGYRCSAELADGTTLPCVMIGAPDKIVSLAERRISEVGRSMLAHFTTTGNRVNEYDIKSVRPSRYAMPMRLLRQVRSETSMGWTAFVLETAAERKFSFGSAFSFEFFDLPDGVEFEDFITVHNHSFVESNDQIRSAHSPAYVEARRDPTRKTYRERPYFWCFAGGP